MNPPPTGRPRLGRELGRGAEGVVYENADQPGWAVKVFHQGGTSPFQAGNEFANLERARAISGRADNVIQVQPPSDPRQGWLVKEQVNHSATLPDFFQRVWVLQDFLNIPDAGSNLMWGVTVSNSVARWILIE